MGCDAPSQAVLGAAAREAGVSNIVLCLLNLYRWGPGISCASRGVLAPLSDMSGPGCCAGRSQASEGQSSCPKESRPPLRAQVAPLT